MNDVRQPIVRATNQGRLVAVVGDLYRFLAEGTDTAGKYATIDATVPPGGGPPPHKHSREEESFYVLEGEITFSIDDKQTVAGPGTFVQMPIGVWHGFRNNSDRPARMIISVAPAGLEQMFIEIGTPMAEGSTTAQPPTPEEIGKLLAAAPRYGIEVRVPPH
ncbi:MAG: cupin domain-containing protein [Pirellula sp.]|nr:cupin domain-containing protein [Pirellula sp.]